VMMCRAAGVRRDVKKPSMVLAAMRGASGLCGIPLIEMRGWRAEKRKPMVSAILADHGDASRRASHGVFSATGRAFRMPGFPSRSASSWQGLIVVPGGAPMPPECLTCVAKPAGAAPRPASSFASRSALQVDEVMGSLREVWTAGISSRCCSAENQKQTFLIVGHRAKPLTDAAFASAATRSG